MAKFERRFEGPANAGLRAKIRIAVASKTTGEPVGDAVRCIGAVVALTAAGKHTLEQVAQDYEAAAGRATGAK